MPTGFIRNLQKLLLLLGYEVVWKIETDGFVLIEKRKRVGCRIAKAKSIMTWLHGEKP